MCGVHHFTWSVHGLFFFCIKWVNTVWPGLNPWKLACIKGTAYVFVFHYICFKTTMTPLSVISFSPGPMAILYHSYQDSMCQTLGPILLTTRTAPRDNSLIRGKSGCISPGMVDSSRA